MTTGIHHISSIASDAASTIRFFTSVLGLRLVKKTVNQDDVSTMHLFFGDRTGNPGMDMTFFIFRPMTPGTAGNGMVSTVSFAVPEQSFAFWMKQLPKHSEPVTRFGKKRIEFQDPDGGQYELVFVPDAELDPHAEIWETKKIPKEHAIRHFYSAMCTVSDIRLIEPVLTSVFGYTRSGTDKNIVEFSVTDSARASVIEVMEDPTKEWGVQGSGSVHHIAFRANDSKQQQELRTIVVRLGLTPTTVIDRFYFRSVYFRIPSGILFEIATDGPGFTADENETALGEHLSLPPFLESQRREIEKNLPDIVL